MHRSQLYIAYLSICQRWESLAEFYAIRKIQPNTVCLVGKVGYNPVAADVNAAVPATASAMKQGHLSLTSRHGSCRMLLLWSRVHMIAA